MKTILAIITLFSIVLLNQGCSTAQQAATTKIPRSLHSVLQQYGVHAQKRLVPYFQRAQIAYPPKAVTIVNNKSKRSTELWARNQHCWRLIKRYPITASSGRLGPKLRAHDRQIPEGVYKILYLNPNSQYHLSMMLDYPNTFDKQKAIADGRKKLGSDIFIHGKASSVGCVAVGDNAIEELFTLVHDVGRQNVKVINIPYDIKRRKILIPQQAPKWTHQLYHHLAKALHKMQPICHA